MSYQVLARKWRPQSFDELCGQPHVTTPLRNAIRTHRVPHAILLTGPRGVGKTTIARLLARGLNCEKGPTDSPCDQCVSCREIAAGTSPDVQEIDAASHTSVDDVRELIEAVRYAPVGGKHRIFVVDEVHMLSTPAFNALLKTLEEPPPHGIFVLATTNPEKIPFTVLSRCQRYDLRRLATSEVSERLEEVARSEGIEISERSRLAIARESDGSLRDALTLLDQVIAVGAGSGSVDDELVAEVLDLIDRRLLLAMASACVRGEPGRALEACARAAESGIDPKRLGAELLRVLRDLVVLRVAPQADGLVEGNDAEVEELMALAKETEPTRLRRMFRALLREQEDLTWAPEPFAVLEMAVVRLATLAPGDEVSELLTRLDALERQLTSAGEPPPTSGRRAGGGGGGDGRGARKASARKTQRAPDPPEESASLGVVFDRLLAFAQRESPGLFAALEGGELLERSDAGLRLRLPSALSTRRLRGRIADLEAVCGRFFGTATRVRLDDESPPEPDIRRAPPPQETATRQLRQEALRHPVVNDAIEKLGGEILEIRPLGGES